MTRAWVSLSLATVATCIGLGSAPEAHALPPLPANTPVRTYIVQPGDSAWSIAEQFFGNGERYPIIYQYNGFAAVPPFLLTPGQVLRLPIIGQGPEAEVAWLMHDVKAKPPRAVDWLAAREQMSLWRLYRVSTGDASAARIVFEDQSDLKLRERALLVIYGASASAARTTRQDKTEVVLESGTIVGGLAALDANGKPSDSRLKVKTSSGEVEVLGRAIQVQAEQAIMMVSAFMGNAKVAAQGGAVTVKESEGTVVERGKKPEPPRPLPLAPRWLDADPKTPETVPTAIVARLPGQTANWEAAWAPVTTAATYRVELASDTEFQHVIYDAEVGAGITRVKLADLKVGRYYVRVAARDARQLESRPAAPRALDVVALELARAATISKEGVLEVVGYARIAAPKGFLLKDLAAEANPKPDSVLRLVTPGRHEIDLYTNDGATPAHLAVEVIGVTPRLTAPTPANRKVPREPHLDPLRIGIKLIDARGRPATLPGVTITQLDADGDTGTNLPVRVDSGVYLAEVPAAAWNAPETVTLRVAWAGGILGQASLPIEVALPPEDEGIYGWNPALARAERGVRGWAQPAPMAPGDLRLGLAVGVAGRDAASGLVDMQLAGELPVGEHLVLAAEFGFQSIWFDERGTGQNRIGDLAVGGRWRVQLGPVALAPYLRLAIPVGRGELARLATVEPGLAARIELVQGLMIDARVAAAIGSDFGKEASAALAGSAALTWRPGVRASLSLGWETQAMAWAQGDAYASGNLLNSASLGAAFYFGRARLALSAGMGVGDEGQTRLGVWLARAVLDIGLGGD